MQCLAYNSNFKADWKCQSINFGKIYQKTTNVEDHVVVLSFKVEMRDIDQLSQTIPDGVELIA